MIARTFFERFGHLGVCVLPAEVLTADLLRIDPETHTIPSSLRQMASSFGICFARILRSCGDDLYWADVAPTPDLADAQRIVLTEEHLYATLPWDIRLTDQHPGDIRRMLFAHAQEVRPAQQLADGEEVDQPHVLTSAPIVPLQPLEEAAVVFSASELRDAFDPDSPNDDDDFPSAGLLQRFSQKIKKPTRTKHIGACTMQQTLLGAMIDALMNRLYHAQDAVAAFRLKAQCALLAVLQRWQRLTRQRVVNAVPFWSEEQQRVVWQLTAGIPVEVLA